MILTYKNVSELIDFLGFTLMVSPEGLSVVDNQLANLGGIEEDTFSDYKSLLDRFDMYYQDYIIQYLEDHFDIEEPFNNYEDLLQACRDKGITGGEVYFLEMIVEGEC